MSAVRKTLTYLGLMDPEETTYEEEAMIQITTPAKKIANRLQSVANPYENQIATIHPQNFRDAKTVAENYRLGITTIIDLHKTTDTDAKRIIDFCSGLVMGLEGTIERITSRVFLLAPHNTNIITEGKPNETGTVDTSMFNN